MTVYIDLIFFVNFVMDLLVFWVAVRLCQVRTRARRIFLGALTSAALYCVFLVFWNAALNAFSGSLLFAAGLCVVQTPKKIREFAAFALTAVVASCGIGGLAFALMFFGRSGVPLNSLSAGSFPVRVLVCASAMSYVAVKTLVLFLRNRAARLRQIFAVHITLYGKTAELRGLCDTGNHLSEPFSRKAVIIADFSAVRRLLPKETHALWESGEETDLRTMLEILERSDFRLKIKLLPFRTVGRENGMMMGFLPDSAEIMQSAEKNAGKQVSAVIGVYQGRLSESGEYDCIFPPTLL